MKRLDKFLVTSFIGPFFAILFVVLFILVMQFLWLYIDELVGKGLAMKVILEFLFWGACTILPMALPLATLLSSMMIMGQLSENNELSAMKASGVSVTRVMYPLIVICLIISVLTFFVTNNLVPYSYNQIFTLRDDIGRTKSEIKIPSGTFYDGIDGYILRNGSTDEQTGMMYDVMVYDHSGNKGNTTLALADSAVIKMSKKKDYLTFTMFDGVNYQEDNTMKFRDTSLALQRIDFARQDMVISLENYAFEKSDSGRFSDQIKSMNIVQLRRERDSLEVIEHETHADQFHKLISNGNVMKFHQLDTAARFKEMADFNDPGYLRWRDLREEQRAYSGAATKANQMVSDVTMFSRDSYEYTFYLRRSRLEILKKYAVALACFLMFFIGAPIGALIRRGGLGVPAIISVLFFVLYWVVDISGTKLAKDGALNAFHGAFISAYVLGPIGVLLTHRAVHDASLSGSDTLKARWRKLKSLIVGLVRKPRIVYMGTPEFAVAPLERLLKDGRKVVGVVTVADKASGRGLKLSESAVKKYAVEHGLPVLQPVKLKDPAFLAELAALKADIFVVVAFRMLPEEVWSMPRLGTFNLHAALLPQYRGAAPINWAVINGEKMTGVTTFMIDKNIDTGGIILRQEYRIKPGESAGDVHDALMGIGSDLVSQTVQGLIERNVEVRVQRSFIQGSEELKPAPKLTRELCHIDWNDSTVNIINLIRGLSPYPTAYTELVREGQEPQQLKIFSAETLEAGLLPGEGTAAAPGTVLSDSRSYLAVATADGAVRIRELQLSGKKRMGVEDFLRGMREISSYTTTPGTSRAEKARLCAPR